MTRLYNDPVDFKEEMLQGFVRAYGRYVKRVPDASGVMAVDAPQSGKVSVLVGGGSGHYPAFCGYVGPGLADVAAMGEGQAAEAAREHIAEMPKEINGLRFAWSVFIGWLRSLFGGK